MTMESTALWAKLDEMHRSVTNTREAMLTLAGELRKENAENRGEMRLQGQRIDTLEEAFDHHRRNDLVAHEAIANRHEALAKVTDGVKGKQIWQYGFAAGISAAVSFVVTLMKMGGPPNH